MEYVRSFFQEDKQDLLLNYSYLGKYRPDLFLQGKQEQFDESARLAINRASIVTLYQKLYEGLKKQTCYFSKPGRTIIEVENYNDYIQPEHLNKEDRTAWDMENCFYYNLSQKWYTSVETLTWS